MENHFPSEVSHVAHHENKNEVRNVTIVLSVLTIIELILGFLMIDMQDGSTAKLATKITIIVLMLAKAYYIIGYFMHLKHEIRNLIMTVAVPMLLFVWFITAFLYEGNSFRNLRNNNDPHFKEQSTIKKEKVEHGAKPHGEKHEEKKVVD
jgi:cytochrome c oxidase subunit 4